MGGSKYAIWLVIGAALVAGVAAICFAARGFGLAALVATVLSFSWSVFSVGLAAISSGDRRVRAEMQDRIVEPAVRYLLCEAKCRSEHAGEGGEARDEWPGLVDRIHELASKALEVSTSKRA